jgi:DNA-binding NtrC family response regulator
MHFACVRCASDSEAQVRRPGLPAVLLTGYAGEAAHLAISGAPPGAFSLLRKPVSVAQLVDRIEMVLAAKAIAGREDGRARLCRMTAHSCEARSGSRKPIKSAPRNPATLTTSARGLNARRRLHL